MKVLGITGGFCAGKTTVAKFFESEGARAINADRLVHEIYEKNEVVKKAVLENFGREVFSKNKIKKSALAKKAFKNKKSLKKLCAIVHPVVINKIKAVCKKSRAGLLVVDAPLLLEADLGKCMDYILVVRADKKKQLLRCRKRGFTKKDFLLRASYQKSLAEKIKEAHFVIDNSGSKEKTKKEVKRLYKKLQRR